MKKMTVADAMSARTVRVKPDDTVATAAKLMAKGDFGSLPVVSGAKLAGLITSGDIMKRVVAKNKPLKTKVKDVMTKTPVTIAPGTELVDAMKLMAERGIRRLLVVEDGKLRGVLTDGDVLREAPEMIDYLYSEIEKLKEDVGAAQADDVCESCGNFTTDLKTVNGELLCEECRESSTYI